jgi:predicted nuclease of predicted toxin-antitoxin system
MKLLIDAQLPKLLADFFRWKGYDAVHTLELPAKNATPDAEIMRFADNEDRFVVTKDIDFYESKIINNTPLKLIIISTGNITNKDLLQLIDKNIDTIEKLAKEFAIIEIDKHTIKVSK